MSNLSAIAPRLFRMLADGTADEQTFAATALNLILRIKERNPHIQFSERSACAALLALWEWMFEHPSYADRHERREHPPIPSLPISSVRPSGSYYRAREG